MVRRRSHNEYARIYDPTLMGRPLAYEGLPCASCQFPVLGSGIRDHLGRWRHRDCAEPASIEDVELYVVYHVGAEHGLDEDDVRQRLDAAELRARAQAVHAAWLSRATASARDAPGASDSRGEAVAALERITSLKPIFTDPLLCGPVAEACDDVLWALRRNGMREMFARIWTSRSAANVILLQVGNRVDTVTRPPSSRPGYLYFRIPQENVQRVQADLERLRET